MTKMMICMTLLLFELVASLFGHSLPVTEMNNATDVYEIQEGSSSQVRIINPKPEKPTLREIVYLHVIERPYQQIQDSKEGEEKGPDFDDTRRPFTNSHGYQFIGNYPEIGMKHKDLVDNSLNKDGHDYYDIDKRTDEVNTSDEHYKTEDNIPNESSKEDVYGEYEEDTTEEINDTKETVKEIFEPRATSTTAAITVTQNAEEMAEVDRDATVHEVVLEQKHARNQLFNQDRERYKNKRKHNNSPISRRKRENRKEEIPDAPILPELNYDSLPEYVRILISTEKPITVDHSRSEDKFNKYKEEDDIRDEIKEAIEHEIEDMFEENEEDFEEDSASEEQPMINVARTYGMNLTMNRGYVWNDLWSKYGLSYEVGELEIVEEVEENQDDSEDTIDSESDSTENIFEPLNDKHESHNPVEFDIFVNINKNKASNGTEKLDHKKDLSNEKLNNEDLNTNKKTANNEGDNKYTSKDHETKDDAKEVRTNLKLDNGTDVEKEENPSILELLMKDEQFWIWLGDWTALYVEVLSEHIKSYIKREVAKQIKHYHKNNKQTQNKIPIEENKDEINVSIINSIKPENPDPTINDGKLIVDGKEIPITHNSNFDIGDKTNKLKNESDLAKKRKDKNQSSNITSNEESQTAVKVEAQTIYGNSMGNEKVTNVFVFYSNKNLDKIAENLKPLTDTANKNGTFTFGPHDNITIDIRQNIPDSDKIEHDHGTEEELNTYVKEDKPINPIAESSLGNTEGKDYLTLTNKYEENNEKITEDQKAVNNFKDNNEDDTMPSSTTTESHFSEEHTSVEKNTNDTVEDGLHYSVLGKNNKNKGENEQENLTSIKSETEKSKATSNESSVTTDEKEKSKDNGSDKTADITDKVNLTDRINKVNQTDDKDLNKQPVNVASTENNKDKELDKTTESTDKTGKSSDTDVKESDKSTESVSDNSDTDHLEPNKLDNEKDKSSSD